MHPCKRMSYVYVFHGTVARVPPGFTEIEMLVPGMRSETAVQVTANLTVYQVVAYPDLPGDAYLHKNYEGIDVYIESDPDNTAQWLFMISTTGRRDSLVLEIVREITQN